jgi:hypothetical protein
MSKITFTHKNKRALDISKDSIRIRLQMANDYRELLSDMWSRALRGEATAHIWLGRERRAGGVRPSYKLRRDPIKGLCHWRIAARLNDAAARNLLEDLGEDLGEDRIPEAGQAVLPGTNKLYDLTRTSWIDGSVLPIDNGLYERQCGKNVVYAIWNGSRWSSHRDNLGQLVDEHAVHILSFTADDALLPWRALAADPNPPAIAFVPPQYPIRPGIKIDAYIAQRASTSSPSPVVHMAISADTKGEYLPLCAVTLPKSEMYLVNKGPNLKVMYGERLPLCENCEHKACDKSASSQSFRSQDDTGSAITVDSSNLCATSDIAIVGDSANAAADPKFMGSTYFGSIEYENESCTPVEKFHFLTDRSIDIELYSTLNTCDEDNFYALRGKATLRNDGTFVTSWIELQVADGGKWKGVHAMLEFIILERNDESISIQGQWLDHSITDAYPFFAILPRKPIDWLPLPDSHSNS